MEFINVASTNRFPWEIPTSVAQTNERSLQKALLNIKDGKFANQIEYFTHTSYNAK